MSVRELAGKTGISASHILRIESGEYDFTTTKFFRLCEALGLPINSMAEPFLFNTRDVQAILANAAHEKAFRLLTGEDSGREHMLLNLVDVYSRVLIALYLSENPVGMLDSIVFEFGPGAERLRSFAARLNPNSSHLDRINSIAALVSHPLGKMRELQLLDEDVVRALFATPDFDWGSIKITHYIAEPLRALRSSRDETFQQRQEALDKERQIWHKNAVSHTQITSLPELIKAVRACTSEAGAQSEMARALKVSRQALHQWITGEAKPSSEMTFKLLEEVGKRLGELQTKTPASGMNTRRGNPTRRKKKGHETTKSSTGQGKT